MKTVSLLFLIILPSLCRGQYFSYLHDADSSSDIGTHIALQQDSTYFILGAGGYNPGGRFLFYTQNVTQDGSQLLNVHSFKSSLYSYYSGYTGRMKSLPNGNFLVTLIGQAPTIVPNFGISSQALLAKLNAQGDTIFLKSYTDTNQYWEEAWDCAVMPNGDYVIGGERTDYAQTQKPAIVIKTDSNGNLLWEHEYIKEPGLRTSVNSIQFLDSNKILVGIMSCTPYQVNNHFFSRNRPWFVVTDTSGNIIKDTLYSGTRYAGGGSIFKDMNGGYFHYGDIDTIVNNDVNYWGNFPWYISRLDTNFGMQWTTIFYGSSTYSKNLWTVKQLHDSGYVIVGNYYPLSGHVRGWAAKVDKYGSIIWDNLYENYLEDDAYLVDVIETPNHNLVMVGSAKDTSLPSWHQYDTWILGVDSNGCEMTGCTPSPTRVRQATVSSEHLTVYPNPTNGSFTIDAQVDGKMEVYNIQGQAVAHFDVSKGKTNTQLPGWLPTGVYICKYLSKNAVPQLIRIVYEP